MSSNVSLSLLRRLRAPRSVKTILSRPEENPAEWAFEDLARGPQIDIDA